MEIVKKAKGLEGYLLRIVKPQDIELGYMVLRCYDHPVEYRRKNFKLKQSNQDYDKKAFDYEDYIVSHFDLEIKITDEDAVVLKNKDGKLFIDYNMPV